MGRLREEVSERVATHHEAVEQHFTYFLMQSIHTLPRTQKLSENDFIKKKKKKDVDEE